MTRLPGSVSPAEPRFRALCLGAVLLSLGLQLALIARRGAEPGLDGNEDAYVQVARNWLQGLGLKTDLGKAPTALWGSIHPLAVAAVLRLTGGSLPAVFAWNASLMAAAVGLTARLTRHAFGPAAGVLAGLLAALHPYFLQLGPTALSEPLFLCLLLASLDLAVSLPERPGPGRWVALGMLLGAMSLARSPGFYFIPVLAAWLARERPAARRPRSLAALLFGLALLLGPWTLRNYRLYGAFLPLDSKAGYNLYFAMHPAHDGPLGSIDFRGPIPIPEVGDPGYPDEATWNRELTREALRFAREDPARTLRYALAKAWYAWTPLPGPGTAPGARRIKLFSMTPLIALAAAGLLFARPRRGPGLLLALLLGFVFAMHLVVYGGPRTRIAADPALVSFAAAALGGLPDRVRRLRTAGGPMLP